MRALAVIVLACGCVRDPAEAVCPTAVAGALAVTEVRGPQTPDDSLGPWIELYNASGAPIDLLGVKVRFRIPDGSGERSILVRRSVPVVAGGYVVLGLFDDTAPPRHVDYGFVLDFHDPWLPGAFIDVEACGTLIDRAQYSSLPRMGTYSLGGAPSADANDLPARWCTDATASGGSYPGTPQAANKTCP